MKYNLGDNVYFLCQDEYGYYSIEEGKVTGIFLDSKNEIETKCRTYKINEGDIATNKDEVKEIAFQKFIKTCDVINEILSGKKFLYSSELTECLKNLSKLNKAFGFQAKLLPYKHKKALKNDFLGEEV